MSFQVSQHYLSPRDRPSHGWVYRGQIEQCRHALRWRTDPCRYYTASTILSPDVSSVYTVHRWIRLTDTEASSYSEAIEILHTRNLYSFMDLYTSRQFRITTVHHHWKHIRRLSFLQVYDWQPSSIFDLDVERNHSPRDQLT